MLLIFLVFLSKSVWCGDMDYIPKDWIDPNDMRNYDRMTKTMKTTHIPSSDYEANTAYGSCGTERLSDSKLREDNKRLEIFIERFINRLLQSANLKDRSMPPGTKMVTEIPFSITAEELSKLTTFGHGFKTENLTDLDYLLSMILTYERGFTFDSMMSYLNPVQELFWNMSLEKLTIIIGIAVTSVTLWMFAIGNSIKRIMMFLYILCFISGLAFNAWNMYMEAVSEQIAESKKYLSIPDACDPKRSSWWSYFFSMKDECKEFHRTMRVDPLSRVVPSIVFSQTLAMMLVHPLKDIGAKCGDFLYGVSNSAPWPLNIIFLPFVLIVFCLVFTFIVVIQLGASLNCWTLLGGLSIGVNKSKNEDNQANEALLNEIQSLKKIIESDLRIKYQPEAGDGNFNVVYQRSQSIASCSTQDCVNLPNSKSNLSNGNDTLCEEDRNDKLLNAVGYLKSYRKPIFYRSLSQKSSICKKKYK